MYAVGPGFDVPTAGVTGVGMCGYSGAGGSAPDVTVGMVRAGVPKVQGADPAAQVTSWSPVMSPTLITRSVKFSALICSIAWLASCGGGVALAAEADRTEGGVHGRSQHQQRGGEDHHGDQHLDERETVLSFWF